MRDEQFNALSGEFLASANPTRRQRIADAVRQSRELTPGLAPVVLDDVEVRPLSHNRIEELMADPVFAATFGARPYHFAWVRPERLVALQTFVQPRDDPTPASVDELVELCLPLQSSVPAELSFQAPLGPVYMMSSSPQMQGIRINMDAATNRLILEPPLHLNLVQAVQFARRTYLRNGYHRLYDLMKGGASEVPALVVEGIQPQDVALPPSPGAFDLAYLMSLARPPVLGDFVTDSAVDVAVRERRYGVSIALQINPISVGL